MGGWDRVILYFHETSFTWREYFKIAYLYFSIVNGSSRMVFKQKHTDGFFLFITMLYSTSSLPKNICMHLIKVVKTLHQYLPEGCTEVLPAGATAVSPWPPALPEGVADVDEGGASSNISLELLLATEDLWRTRFRGGGEDMKKGRGEGRSHRGHATLLLQRSSHL